MKNILVLSAFIFCLSEKIIGQSNEDLALAKGREAIKMMESGKIDESVALLKAAMALDPNNIVYPYEIGYAYYLDKKYENTVNILSGLIEKKDADDLVYQLLGNSYDNLQQREKAIEIYELGLKKKPKSGKLYLELGSMYLMKKDYEKAVQYYEKGIAVEPNYASNYYRLAKLFLNSDEEVWGMIYGELFMNLERNTARTAEISKKLYDTYKSEIIFSSDTSFSVSFSKSAIVNISNKKVELPFGVGVYEPTLMMEMLNEKAIDLHSLDRIRRGFVANYFKNKRDKKYPNILFSYQNKVIQAGHFEAYNRWILMKGDEQNSVLWQEENPRKWEDFVAWYNANGLELTDRNKFLRTQY